MEKILENLNLSDFQAYFTEQSLDLESFKQCMSNDLLANNLLKQLYSRGLAMGDLAKLVGAVEDADKVKERTNGKPMQVTPPQVGKLSASRRALLLDKKQ